MRAKATREKREYEQAAKSSGQAPTGIKRSREAMSSETTPATLRDAGSNRPLDAIKPARNFTRYVDYDFSKMTDTKGGFLTETDDPYNKALHVHDGKTEEKPAYMTQKEWERQQLLKSIRRDQSGPFEPGISVLDEARKTCRECGRPEIDWKWEKAFGCCVCNTCKEAYPDKYSLLTKTEAKEDYLLTDCRSHLYIHLLYMALMRGSGTPRRRTPSTNGTAKPAQINLEQHDALPPLPSRGVCFFRPEMGIPRGAGRRV